MLSAALCTNTLLEYRLDAGKTRTERVLWIDPSGDLFVTIDIDRKNKHALPVWKTREEIKSALGAGSASIAASDPWAVLQLHDDKPLENKRLEERRIKRQKHRDRAWAAIEPLVKDKSSRLFDPNQRGALIADLARKKTEEDEKKERKGFIYDALRRWWQGGQTKNALLPFFGECGAAGKERVGTDHKLGRHSARARIGSTPAGIILTDDVRSKLFRGYEEYYVSGKEKTLPKAHQRTLETYFSSRFDVLDGPHGKVYVPILLPADQLPSFLQFRYVHEKYDDLTRLLTSREGERRFALRHRAILGESTHMAWGPGTLYQGDSTIGDIHLVSSRDRSRLIGRPVIYVIIDVFSRLIVGFSVSLQGPSWLGMALALYNATVDKVAYCKGYGIDITEDMWPSYGLPEAILGDRGELEGYDSTNLVASLDIDVANTPPYRCDWKAICEQNFRTVSDDVIHWKPGAVYTKRERGDDDYRLEACLTLPEFREMMIRCILKHNNHHRMDWYDLDEFMITDHVEPYPIDLWNWGITHSTGHLQKKEEEVIQFKLLPREPGSVTEFGIYFKGAHYTCERAIKEQWFVKARNRGRMPVTVAYDPRKLDTIYLLDKEGKPLNKEGKPEACELVERERGKYQGRDWFEILDYFELQKQAEEASRSRQYQAEAEFNAHIDSIVKNAQEKTAQATKGMSKAAHLSNSKGHRQTEKDDEAARDAWTPGKEKAAPSKLDTRAPEGQVEEAETSYVPPDQPLDAIRKLREEKWAKSQGKEVKTNG
jgi:Mu transposase, C-terminal